MKGFLDNSTLLQKSDVIPLSRKFCSKSKFIPSVFFNLLIFNLLIFNLHAQPTQEWAARYQRTINSSGNKNFLGLDKLGNSYVVGEIYDNVTSVDIVIIKYNSIGDSVWTRRYNSFNNVDDTPQGMAVDSLGNVFITCYTGLNLGPFDVLTIKYNPNGTLLWVSRYAGSGNANDIINDIKLDLTGNIIVTGFSGVTALTIKYNILGDSIWVRKKQQAGFEYSGGFIGIDVSSGIHIAGTKFNISSNQGDIMVLKYDSSGTEQWVSSYANSGLDGARGIAIDGSGNSYVTET